MSIVKSKNLQVGTDATASNNFTIYQPSTPDGTLRIGVGNADSPTEVGRFDSNGYVATNAPAFSAYLSSTQTVSAATNTKIQFNTELFDTNNCYDNSTNYRFTPNVAGYYQVCISLSSSPSSTATVINLYKNGSVVQSFITQANNGITCIWNLPYIVYLNGSTDYLEFYGQCNGSTNFVGGLGYSSVQASMVRAA